MQCTALLFTILEKCKRVVDTKNIFGALLTDLLKAFNCLPHKVIIARLNRVQPSSIKSHQKLLSQWKTKRQGKLFIQLFEWYTLWSPARIELISAFVQDIFKWSGPYRLGY